MAGLRVFMLLWSLTAITLLQTAPVSAQEKYSFGCFGSAGACLDHHLVCPNTSRVAIEQALYGHKEWVNCTTGVISCQDACCKYDLVKDCFNVFVAGDIVEIYRNCTENACLFRTPRMNKQCLKPPGYHQFISSYSVVQYECVPETQIIPMCGMITERGGTSISVIYDPRSQYKANSQLCWCSVFNPGRNEYRIEGIDLRLNTSANCGQVIVQEGGKNILYHNCNSRDLWPNLSIGSTSGLYTHVFLSGAAEFAWIRFTASLTPLIVTCSLNGEHITTTTVPTTTEETTTQTTTTTTTTTYPQNTWTPSTTQRPKPTSTVQDTTTVQESTTVQDTTQPRTASQHPTSTVPYQTESSSDTSPDGSTDTASGSTGKQTTTSPSDSPPTESSGLVDDVTLYGGVGGAVAAIALLLVVGIAVVCCCRRNSSSLEEAKTEDTTAITNPGYASPVYDNAKIANGGALANTVDDSGYTKLTPQYDNIKPDNNNIANAEKRLSKPIVSFEDEIAKPENVQIAEHVQDGLGDTAKLDNVQLIDPVQDEFDNKARTVYNTIDDPVSTTQEVTVDIEDLPPPVDEAGEFLNSSENVLVDAETGNALQNEVEPVLEEASGALEEAAPQSDDLVPSEDTDVQTNDITEDVPTPPVPTPPVPTGMIRL